MYSSSRSSKVDDFGTNRKCKCEFLLVINSNFGHILHRFWDTDSICCRALKIGNNMHKCQDCCTNSRLQSQCHTLFCGKSSQFKAKIHYTSFHVARPQQVRAGKSPLFLWCRVVSQIPLQRFVANKLAASPSTRKLRGNLCNGLWALSINITSYAALGHVPSRLPKLTNHDKNMK